MVIFFVESKNNLKNLTNEKLDLNLKVTTLCVTIVEIAVILVVF